MSSPRERILKKTKLEINKDIERAINLAKQSGKGELYYYLHYLHFIRILNVVKKFPDSERVYMTTLTNQVEDAYVYIIQLLLKYSDTHFRINPINEREINPTLVQALTKLVLHLNSKYEAFFNFTLFKNIEVSGERDQFAKIDLRELEKDEYLNKFFTYGARLDRGGHIEKNKLKTKDDFLLYFKKQYAPYADLFEQEFTISLDVFIDFIDYLLNQVISQITNSSQNFDLLENGDVDIQSINTILGFADSLIISRDEVYDKFGPNIEQILQRLSFDVTQFDENQLKYNSIFRRPIINIHDNLIISPEILMDSLFINSHYTLLEADKISEEYKHRYANNFLNTISDITKVHGYAEVSRELDLFDGKNKIGDLDLILKKGTNYLLIEAKNHSLPLDVYFHDFISTQNRLLYLQEDWEKKVKKRNKHLLQFNNQYDIGKDFTYIIVTKYPEILSHFTDLLVLSIDEFEFWLEQGGKLKFERLKDDFYDLKEPTITSEQLKSIEKDLVTPWSYRKE